jgi:hypothetical protein
MRLTKAAQVRNRAETITGLVLYDNCCFFQWLEGPEDSLLRVMQSISNDVRHTDVEILTRQHTGARTFAGWDLKLALAGAAPAKWTREVITPSQETIETLRRRPEIAASILERLAPVPSASARARTSSILEAVIRDAAIPHLATRHVAAPATPLAAELAEILLRGDTEAALALLRQQTGEPGAMTSLRTALIEPAARHLGDMWMRDRCGEFDVTLGLCVLQTAVRRVEREQPVSPWHDVTARAVLVVPQPGEMHGLSASLAAHAFRRAGWAVYCDFPVDEAALQDVVAANWFDVVDMSLSAAFRREDRLHAMTRSIRLMRTVSGNRDLKIAVGGRIFTEQATALAQVGADARSDAMAGLRSGMDPSGAEHRDRFKRPAIAHMAAMA